MLLDEKVNYLTEKIINKLLESYQNPTIGAQADNKYIYHCAREKGILNVFKYGFERYFIGKGVGGMYGPGIYATTDLESSIVNARRGLYGNAIIRAEMQSYDRFLIWEPKIAKLVYGNNWRISDQLEMFLPEFIDEMKHLSVIGEFNDHSPNMYDFLIKGRERTSVGARQIWLQNSKFHNGKPFDKISGFVFFGSQDGHVAVIKDVKNPIPLEYSTDYGKTWIDGRTEETLRYTKHDFDVDLLYGKDYDKVSLPEFGWAKVQKNGKVNYINKDGKTITKTWFDSGSDFMRYSDNMHAAKILFNDEFAYLATNGYIYEDLDEQPVCSADDLSD